MVICILKEKILYLKLMILAVHNPLDGNVKLIFCVAGVEGACKTQPLAPAAAVKTTVKDMTTNSV